MLSSQCSNPDSSSLSLESSFQLDPSFSSQRMDSEKHPKGKRKRTTTQDKSILEAAYHSNPKPDKAARLDIVKRVSLNEKEVQIWFQNRRQNDRRKSRPLSLQEIAALRYGGGMHVLSSDPANYGNANASGSSEDGETRPEDASAAGMDQRALTPEAAGSQHSTQLSPEASQPARVFGDAAGAEAEAEVSKQEKQERRDSAISCTPPSSQRGDGDGGSQLLSHSLSSSIGYLSNRWNVGTSFSTPATLSRPGDESLRLESFPSSANSTANNSPASILLPPSTSSSVRITFSLEGKAELLSSRSSPPRPVPTQLPVEIATLPPVRNHRTLQRSRSALPGITLPPISTLTASLPPQLTRGRSRNVHAWESVCEPDTMDELTAQAENESSGSAIAAISLLRSSSQTSTLSGMIHNHSPPSNHVLQSNPGKRNAPPTRRDSGKKPRLSRSSSSSIARIQARPSPEHGALQDPLPVAADVEVVDNKEDVGPAAKKSNNVGLALVLSPSGGDSDKENWSPDEEGNPTTNNHHHNNNNRRRRPLPPGASAKTKTQTSQKPVGNPRRVGRALGEKAVVKRTVLGSRSNTAPMPRMRGGRAVDSSVSIFEDGNSGKGDAPGRKGRKGVNEVERFMHGEVSPSKKPDMDCVAGLLSLSQGNWR
ncbi:uncharacterized protein BCR38DRAFT_456948 [Pseudomassariella vexata]|uniref:Homeobox domain-containing protein n=1 Tax=Pseudomassariella vexata TaxID=1141098 RepID=A0A1Y2E4U7_9PEZI|nr:uncharacterized protein BCR38DRAFT_456948 [Pseudomassariella vexata]ORY66384.1 hypothetical protein BCR38DRAFT_456948 [Pseudomassariella vexata]